MKKFLAGAVVGFAIRSLSWKLADWISEDEAPGGSVWQDGYAAAVKDERERTEKGRP